MNSGGELDGGVSCSLPLKIYTPGPSHNFFLLLFGEAGCSTLPKMLKGRSKVFVKSGNSQLGKEIDRKLS